MNRLAWRSLRARSTAFIATGLSIFLGAVMILAFLSLLDTGLADGVTAADRELLVTMATVVGSWGLILVVFSVASTLGLAVRRRTEEFGRLRTVGATRRQVRRLVLRETLGVGIGATLLAVLPGWLLGRAVLDLVVDGGLVAAGTQHRLGVIALAGTAGIMLVATVGASALAVRWALRGTAVETLTAGRTGRRTMGRWRVFGGAIFLAAGATYSLLTVTVMADSDDPYAAMMTAGPASVFWSVGLALFAPVLLRGAAVLASPLMSRAGSTTWLAVFNARQRAGVLSSTLMPVIVFVGIGTGTLYLMSIENSTAVGTASIDGQIVALLNYVVVGMIAVFAAIMVVNTLVAAVGDRRREFGQQRLVGSTRGQVRRMLLVEGGLIVATGITLGGLASLGSVIPYALVKTDGWWPTSGPWLFLGIATAAVALTLGTTRATGKRATSGRAVHAATVG